MTIFIFLFFIFATLLCIVIINSLIFYILVGRKIKLFWCFVLVSVSTALNRLLFTGSGFFLSSYLSRNRHLSFSESLSAFFVMEFFGVLLWIPLGIYFGAAVTIKIPWIFWLITVAVFSFIYLQRKKIRVWFVNLKRSLKNLSKNIPFVIPLILLNGCVYIAYYYFLLSLFDFFPTFLQLIRIISLSFTLGYLSPAPSGLGFKDTGLILLLVKEGLSLNKSILCAIIDRGITTFFWVILGLLFGFDLIREEVKRLPFFARRSK